MQHLSMVEKPEEGGGTEEGESGEGRRGCVHFILFCSFPAHSLQLWNIIYSTFFLMVFNSRSARLAGCLVSRVLGELFKVFVFRSVV